MSGKPFRPSWWLRGRHGQTIWPALTRRIRIEARCERLELPDGDFVRLDWTGTEGPIVVVLPGLQGDLGSAYVRGLLRACQRRGWRSVLLNYRGRGEVNRRPQSYHCGMTTDLDHLVCHLNRQEPDTTLAVVGFSVGANICLKWLGEGGQREESLPVAAAVGVSAPFHLGGVVETIGRGFSRVYQRNLLRSLHEDVIRKIEPIGAELGITAQEVRRLNTFFEFDDRISAPLHGFDSAEDYYARTRSDVMLEHVRVPTLIVNSRDDPLVPPHLIPDPSDVSDKVTLEITEGGGHLGFVSGSWPWSPHYWLDDRITNFLAGFFQAHSPMAQRP
jgi:predicted alpha/beta-fold hydrolase